MTIVRNWREHSGPVIESKDGYEIIQCSQCEFRHLVPIPPEEDLWQIYKTEYYTTEKPLYIERHLEDQEWWEVVYDGRLELCETLLSSDQRDLLDIGSGPGFFLKHAMRRGWKGLGIEPSIRAAEFARRNGVEVINDLLTRDLADGLGFFDLIYMNEVLEHLPDPAAILETATNLLNPGGLLCVIVPNDYNPVQQALSKTFGYPAWWVAPPHHINYFNVSSIQGLVERAGMTIVNVETTFPIDLFLLMGDNYVGDDEMGRRCHAKRKRLEVSLDRAGLSELKRNLYQSFAELGLGREIQVVGRKQRERPNG